jgi:catechol 2,3-dioxygenase-like lactoylglutathione lyase family enzyme
MLTGAKVIAFVSTTDGRRARRFYEGILGLRVIEDDDFALTLDSEGTTVRVTKVQKLSPASYTVLGWEVADIVASVRTLVGRGVTFERYESFDQDALGIWSAPGGARVAWFRDPDGNVLSLSSGAPVGS